MPICHPRFDNHDQQDGIDRKLLSPREQVLGQLIVILLCLLAILLRSL